MQEDVRLCIRWSAWARWGVLTLTMTLAALAFFIPSDWHAVGRGAPIMAALSLYYTVRAWVLKVVFDSSGVTWRLLFRRGRCLWNQVKAVIPEFDPRGRLYRIRMVVPGAGIVLGQPQIRLGPVCSYLKELGFLTEEGAGLVQDSRMDAAEIPLTAREEIEAVNTSLKVMAFKIGYVVMAGVCSLMVAVTMSAQGGHLLLASLLFPTLLILPLPIIRAARTLRLAREANDPGLARQPPLTWSSANIPGMGFCVGLTLLLAFSYSSGRVEWYVYAFALVILSAPVGYFLSYVYDRTRRIL